MTLPLATLGLVEERRRAVGLPPGEAGRLAARPPPRQDRTVAPLGKLLVVLGLLTAAVGALLLLGDRFPWLRLGRLPGDLALEKEHVRFYLPLGTSILLSLVVSLVLWLLSRRP